MNIRDLQYLVALAKEKNFSQAAAASFVSQPTLSMQIKKLEEELGVQLFERDKRFLQITPAGQVIVNYATQVLQLIAEMNNKAKYFIEPYSGNLKLGLFPTIAPYLLPIIIMDIKQELPNLILEPYEYITQQCINKLLSGELDTILIANQLTNPKLKGIKLFNESFYLVCSKQHKLSNKTVIQTQDFPENELLLLEEGHCLRDQSLDFCKKIGKNSKPIYSGTSLNTVLSMVSLGEGVTLIPALAKNSIDHLPIKIIPFAINPPTRTVYLYYRKSMQRDKLLIKISNIIIKCINNREGIKIFK